MNHAYYFCCCFLLPLIAARGSGQTKCTATDEGNLKCQFPENINSTQRDFSIYFDPDHGSEEQLVACSWVKSQLYCITQKGFEHEGLVSEIAVITIPRSFVSRNGSYRCENVDYPLTAKSCRVPASRDCPRLTRDRDHALQEFYYR
ncbi:uncharacterized protein LOC112567455 [Pomacea canaliculata]|uniref:uncharacterized protein LOC112567455 n=1 Tax=Pomacea canaliculata TaxID=400727 RepID=UPI000D72C68A|nr:uncharacterized protein LOC112567455 [Pomacea canaliculata]